MSLLDLCRGVIMNGGCKMLLQLVAGLVLGFVNYSVHYVQYCLQRQQQQLTAAAAAHGHACSAHGSEHFEKQLSILARDCLPNTLVAPARCKCGHKGVLLQPVRKVVAAKR